MIDVEFQPADWLNTEREKAAADSRSGRCYGRIARRTVCLQRVVNREEALVIDPVFEKDEWPIDLPFERTDADSRSALEENPVLVEHGRNIIDGIRKAIEIRVDHLDPLLF